MEWSGAEWSRVEWSGAEWSGSSGVEYWRGSGVEYWRGSGVEYWSVSGVGRALNYCSHDHGFEFSFCLALGGNGRENHYSWIDKDNFFMSEN